MGKDPGPLAKCQKEGDLLKKKVDKAVKDANKTLSSKKLKNNEEQLKTNYKICYELLPEVLQLKETVDDLDKDKEPTDVRNYNGKKATEVKRVGLWENQLKTSMSKLLPEDKEKEYVKQLKKDAGEASEEETPDENNQAQKEGAAGGSEDEVSGEDDDEEDDDEEETDEDEKDITNVTDDTKVKGDDDDEEESVEEEDDEDESYEDEEIEEKEDTVPKTKVKDEELSEEEELGEEEETEEEEEESGEEEEEEESGEEESGEEEEEKEDNEEKEKDDMEMSTVHNLFKALDDYSGEDGDLSFKKGEILTILNTRDDGWWEAQNEHGKKGVVPSTYLQMYNKYEDVQQSEDDTEEEMEDGAGRKSGKMRWAGIRKALKETSATDVLHAMGAVPSGFRPSTLAYKLYTEDTYKMKNFLIPKLSGSNLFYKDLFYDPATSKVRPRSVGVERVVTLLSCRQIPLPGAGLVTLGRYVRVCLFDGQNILSNIHTIKVSSVDKEHRTWMFSARISDLMDTFMHADFFVRTDSLADNLGILFELGVSYTRQSTNEVGEFSCGWVHLPLRDTDGTVINRSLELQVNGGTPYEKGVEVDPTISRRATGNAFMSLLSGNKQPRLNVRVSIPKKDQKDQMDLLPSTLVGNLSLLLFYTYYRQILADVLLRDRLDLDSTELVHHPALVTFPEVADQHDLMKVLRDAWIEEVRTVKKSEMRDREFMKNTFCKVVNTSVYPLLHKQSMVPYKDGNYQIELERFQLIDAFWKYRTEKRSTLAVLLSSEIEFTPFDMSEVAFNVVGPHCLPRPTHAH